MLLRTVLESYKGLIIHGSVKDDVVPQGSQLPSQAVCAHLGEIQEM